MEIILLAFILVSGFLVVTQDPYYREVIHRFYDQSFYVKCLKNGLKCFLVAFFFFTILIAYSYFLKDMKNLGFNHILCAEFIWNAINLTSFQDNSIDSFERWRISSTIFLSISMVLIAKLQIAYRRIIFDRNTVDGLEVLQARRTEIVEANPIDAFLLASFISSSDFEEPIAVCIELNDGQSLVGSLITIGDPTEKEGIAQSVGMEVFLVRSKQDDDWVSQIKGWGVPEYYIPRSQIKLAYTFDYRQLEN